MTVLVAGFLTGFGCTKSESDIFKLCELLNTPPELPRIMRMRSRINRKLYQLAADDTIQTVRSIGSAIADRVGSTDSSNSSKHLFGRLAIALWRGNACLWLHHLPTLPPPPPPPPPPFSRRGCSE